MSDAVLRNIGLATSRYAKGAWLDQLRAENGELPELEEKKYYLATVHRAEIPITSRNCERSVFSSNPMYHTKGSTEWVETLEEWNMLSPIDVEAIIRTVTRNLICLQHPQPPLFGDGHAAEYIYQAIINGGK